jgi:hypothetical protein
MSAREHVIVAIIETDDLVQTLRFSSAPAVFRATGKSAGNFNKTGDLALIGARKLVILQSLRPTIPYASK